MTRAFGPVGQLGYVVNDIDVWMKDYLAAGVGPWFVSRDMQPSHFVYRGQASPARFDVGISWTGDLMIELIQPLDEHPGPHGEYLRRYGEGLQHVCYFADDFDAASGTLLAEGYEQTLVGGNSGFQFHYFHRPGGVATSIELGRLSDDTKALFKKVIAVCGSWDGSDPYRGPFREAVA